MKENKEIKVEKNLNLTSSIILRTLSLGQKMVFLSKKKVCSFYDLWFLYMVYSRIVHGVCLYDYCLG